MIKACPIGTSAAEGFNEPMLFKPLNHGLIALCVQYIPKRFFLQAAERNLPLRIQTAGDHCAVAKHCKLCTGSKTGTL